MGFHYTFFEFKMFTRGSIFVNIINKTKNDEKLENESNFKQSDEQVEFLAP